MVLDYFDRAFIINRDSDIERLEKATKRLQKIRITAERISAIVPVNQGSFSSVGEKGCVESHLTAIVRARELKLKNVLIFEDDVVFCKNFILYWNNIIEQLKSLQFDIFYFYRWLENGSAKNLRILPISYTLCTHAYAVNHVFFDKYIALLERNLLSEFPRPADLVFNAGNSRLYAPSFNLVGQDANISIINNELKPLRFGA